MERIVLCPHPENDLSRVLAHNQQYREIICGKGNTLMRRKMNSAR